MNLNKVFILGRVTQDPQIKSLPSGQTVTNFGVATNRIFYDKNREKQEQTEFHNVVAFGKLAETATQYLKQGSLVLIEGRLQTRNWQDKDGIKKYRTEIIVESLQLGPKNQSSSNSQLRENPESKKPKPEIKEEDIPTIEEEEIDVKDLPL
ncbi:MAG TPA: single-stranded DNA-binding protein [Candidatus Pacearchaeota archaeon]|nr:single-stranded DNA-binding protein [Candidatus Pacearchaeota archaeon]HOK94123.1 single-stranded DNA-binding protein [Candidatus Pacearchaeota archaeon]HPO75251.1 single-stranded DNA-binding protein [Candidatus Pacearchaeota archaeon]